MAKVDFNAITQHFRGLVGDLVFRRRFGRLQAILRPKPSLTPPSEAQRAQRVEFKEALSYAKSALADPVSRAVYERAADRQQNDARSLAVGDYFKPPVVQKIDMSDYLGRIGDTIAVLADDDVAVKGVAVIVRRSDGTILEQGPAELIHDKWIYRATTAVPIGQNLIVEVTATDWPGNVGKANKLYP